MLLGELGVTGVAGAGGGTTSGPAPIGGGFGNTVGVAMTTCAAPRTVSQSGLCDPRRRSVPPFVRQPSTSHAHMSKDTLSSCETLVPGRMPRFPGDEVSTVC